MRSLLIPLQRNVISIPLATSIPPKSSMQNKPTRSGLFHQFFQPAKRFFSQRRTSIYWTHLGNSNLDGSDRSASNTSTGSGTTSVLDRSSTTRPGSRRLAKAHISLLFSYRCPFCHAPPISSIRHIHTPCFCFVATSHAFLPSVTDYFYLSQIIFNCHRLLAPLVYYLLPYNYPSSPFSTLLSFLAPITQCANHHALSFLSRILAPCHWQILLLHGY